MRPRVVKVPIFLNKEKNMSKFECPKCNNELTADMPRYNGGTRYCKNCKKSYYCGTVREYNGFAAIDEDYKYSSINCDSTNDRGPIIDTSSDIGGGGDFGGGGVSSDY